MLGNGTIFERMNTSFYLGKLFQIPFKLHWTIIPFFIAIPLIAYYLKMGLVESILIMILVVTIILSVILHELGHAFVAKTLGVKTHDIMISVIGGAARLERMPEEPIEEFKIAIAGPLVNLLIFFLISTPLLVMYSLGYFTLTLGYYPMDTFNNIFDPKIFLSIVALSNLFLFLFNLIPAFPMDGGRILRAFLSTRTNRTKATNIASTIGKIFAVLMVFYGLVTFQPISAIIGVFVFVMAEMENRQEKENNQLRKIKAGSISKQNYQRTRLFTPMKDLISSFFNSNDENFIVMDTFNKPIGLIHKFLLEDAMRDKNNEQAVSSYMTQRYAIVNVNDNLIQVYDELIVKDMPLALVMDFGEIQGVIDQDTMVDALNSVKAKG